MSTTFQAQISCLGSKTKYLAELKKPVIRPLIQLAVKSIQRDHIEEGVLDRICEKYNVTQENIDQWYSAVLKILHTHLRYPSGSVKPAEFKECLQDLKLSPDCIEDLSTVAYGQRRVVLVNELLYITKFYPHIKSCRWRIDINISSSVLSRIMEPSIIMEWTLSSGECKMFELSMAKFHQLRHAVASLLREIQIFERRNTFKNYSTSSIEMK
ncbi:COMM domain-containing protein 5 [Neodiprion pinetum]|uniref:COMM domain-containing protein 5 n=1 Tax=Neodiprion lecontei TaxID=441921 RepID=A0A6J0BGM5_NEOLC|nr:COMM domain-containing protein 5 [Neodiprion lecontei]XP_046423453.1 COMM domain-containing protein 5 [Neodiprion fabricii]XP_046475945.1 COMM domain-containing protein 5 [Neodiprion pinetum]